jgi:hypothetical protein
MSNPTINLSAADFDLMPERPLRSPRYWVGKAVAVPLWLALALVYLLIKPE